MSLQTKSALPYSTIFYPYFFCFGYVALPATKHKPPMPLMKLKRSVGMAKAMMDKAKQMQTSTNPTKKVPAAPLPQAGNKNRKQWFHPLCLILARYGSKIPFSQSRRYGRVYIGHPFIRVLCNNGLSNKPQLDGFIYSSEAFVMA